MFDVVSAGPGFLDFVQSPLGPGLSSFNDQQTGLRGLPRKMAHTHEGLVMGERDACGQQQAVEPLHLGYELMFQ